MLAQTRTFRQGSCITFFGSLTSTHQLNSWEDAQQQRQLILSNHVTLPNKKGSQAGTQANIPVSSCLPIPSPQCLPISKHFGLTYFTRPNFTLTLLRTPALPPTFATFIVPLNLNKLDLRDYLWNVYDIRVNSVRSYIQLQKMRQDKPGAKRPSPRRWHRPRSIKRMTVEMEQPFLWPEEPKDFSAYVDPLWTESAIVVGICLCGFGARLTML